jgi:hypothetical protein
MNRLRLLEPLEGVRARLGQLAAQFQFWKGSARISEQDEPAMRAYCGPKRLYTRGIG